MANRVSVSTTLSLPPSSTAPSTSSLLTPALLQLSSPPTLQVDASVQDYLLIELVRTLQSSAKVAQARREEVEKEMRIGRGAKEVEREVKGLKDEVREEVERARKVREEEEEEGAVRARLESIGMHVGGNLVEKLCRDRQRFTDALDSVKFLCKEVWPAVWEKQVDNLRTNHRGVYVLQDTSFRPLIRLSSPYGSADALKRAKLHLSFPCGVIRGALARLGLHGTVVAEVTVLPQCTFQIKLPKAS